MADEDDYLTCPVCYDVFDDPRTMSCGHTFCLSCLRNFADTHSDAIRAKSIPCPFCRQFTEAPDPRAPAQDWAGQLRSNTNIKELCEMTAIYNRHTEEENNTTPETLTQMVCDDHKQQMTLFCKDCKSPLCLSCCERMHCRCQIVPIGSVLPDIIKGLSETKDKLRQASQLIKYRIDSRRRRRENLMREKDFHRQQIKDMCQKVIDAVREGERKLLDDLESEAKEQATEIQLGVRLSERTAKIHQQQSELIDRTLMHGSDLKKYEMFKVCTKLYFEDEGSSGKAHLSKFVLRNKIETIDLLLYDALGSVGVEYEAETDASQDLDVNGVVTIKTDDDEEDPFPVDVAMVSFLGVHSLVVSDNSNCCVKSFYIQNSAVCHERFVFTSPPWGIAKHMTNQILVALPETRHIVRLKVTPELVLISRMTTSKQYRSVTSLGPSVFAAGSSSSEEPCVDIMDFDGHLLKSFTSHFPVKNPSYLSVMNDGKILVSDFGIGSVTCITVSGRMEFTYRRGLQGPSGVAVTNSGAVVVVDREASSLVYYHAYDKYSVQRPKVISLGERYDKVPWGVCSDTFGRLFITQGTAIRVVTKLVGLSVQRSVPPVYWN